DRVFSLSDVGVPQDAQSLGVSGHDAVLDSVVHHLDEMAGAVRSAVQVSLLGRAANGFPPRSAGDVAGAGRQLREDGIEVFHHRILAADHQAVPALPPPDSPPGPPPTVW